MSHFEWPKTVKEWRDGGWKPVGPTLTVSTLKKLNVRVATSFLCINVTDSYVPWLASGRPFKYVSGAVRVQRHNQEESSAPGLWTS